jgi:hypothetical protein
MPNPLREYPPIPTSSPERSDVFGLSEFPSVPEIVNTWANAARARSTPMRHRYPVFVETSGNRVSARFSAPESATMVEVAMKLREKGWQPYKIKFDQEAGVWIASVIDWKQVA